jgi:DNA transformation protein
MPNSDSFVDHVIDLLSLLGPVALRRMFGGHGLYHRGVMFALLDDDELFLKTDAQTRPRFLEAGCRAWVYSRADGSWQETSYFRPPDEAHEDPEAMLPWARLAAEAALRLHAEKLARAAARKPRARPKASPKARAKPKTKASPEAKAKPKARQPKRAGGKAGGSPRPSRRGR